MVIIILVFRFHFIISCLVRILDCESRTNAAATCSGSNLLVEWKTTVDLRNSTRPELSRALTSLRQRVLNEQNSAPIGVDTSRWLQMVIPDRMPP